MNNTQPIQCRKTCEGEKFRFGTRTTPMRVHRLPGSRLAEPINRPTKMPKKVATALIHGVTASTLTTPRREASATPAPKICNCFASGAFMCGVASTSNENKISHPAEGESGSKGKVEP